MKIINTIVLFCLVWLLSCTSSKPATDPVADPIPAHDSFTLQSSRVGELRTMNVWTPPGYATGTESLPVLYMLDGGIKEDFPHVANTLAQLIQGKKIKPIILVGIENTQRRRDLTGPTNNAEDKKIAPVVGGSEPFRAFIMEELFAEVTIRYRTTGRKGIIGESLAGLFVTETLLLKPDMFDVYIAFDPSLWWNDGHLLKTSPQLLDGFPTSPKTFWFAGSRTEGIFKETAALAETLKNRDIKNLRWMYSPEPKEQHHTIFRATKEKALIWALREG